MQGLPQLDAYVASVSRFAAGLKGPARRMALQRLAACYGPPRPMAPPVQQQQPMMAMAPRPPMGAALQQARPAGLPMQQQQQPVRSQAPGNYAPLGGVQQQQIRPPLALSAAPRQAAPYGMPPLQR